MPRVHCVTKNKHGKMVTCNTCQQVIEPGQKYYWWAFRYGGKRTRCINHAPRTSDFTQSKMSGAYAAIEGAQDELGECTSPHDMPPILEACADSIDEVASEYQDSLDNMPENFQQGSTGEEIQEKIDGLNEFAEACRQAASAIEGELEAYDALTETANEDGEDRTSKFEELIETAESVLNDFSL